MKYLLATLVAISGFCVLSTNAQADDVSGKLGFTGIAQAAFPLGEKSTRDLSEDVGHDFGGMVTANVARQWGIGVSYDNINLRGDHQRIEPILANLLYRFNPEKKWVPSLQLGAGIAKASRGRGSFDNVAARAGIGLDYFVCPHFSVGPQVSYTYVSANGDAARNYHVLGAGLLASTYFGGGKTMKAETPTPAPTPAVAKTPPAAPPVDTDGDGVYDDKDKCPGTPRGISVDADGCPVKMEQKVSITLNVLFDTGKDIVKPEYRSEIERVANFLQAYPNINAEIEGHTDDVGPDTANQRLSQRRADSVRAYLIQEFKVDAGRVKAVGYGETKPVADNTTAEGRLKNRRVVATLETVKVQ